MLRRIALLGLVFLALALGLLFAFREPIAMRLMETAVERNMLTNAVEELPDGLHVLLCGAGGPLADPSGKRTGPCVAVIAGRTFFLVDVGSSATRNLMTRGFNVGWVDAVLLTHFHSDHIDGLGELVTLSWVGGNRKERMPLIGPRGVEKIADGFNLAYAQDAVYRTAHHGEEVAATSGVGFVAKPFVPPMPGETRVVYDERGVKVTAFKVVHDPVVPAVGYRIEYGGRALVVSGDTARTEEVIVNANGVDLLVHEALSPRLMGVIGDAASGAGNASIAKVAVDVLDYHASPVQVAEVAQAAGADHLLYYHVVPPLPVPGLDAIYLDGVEDAYDGGVTLGVDGTMISLPAGSDAIEVSER